MNATAALLPGLPDQVDDSQQVFRATMQALARPGTVHVLGSLPVAPSPLTPAAAALLLALADHETPVWLDACLANSGPVADYLRFHTGSPMTTDLARATFVVVSRADALPALDALQLGSLEYPDRSATVILQVAGLTTGQGWRLSGPGIAGVARLSVDGAPAHLVATMARNRALFPRGIDVLFAARDRIAALPRTTIIES